MESFGPDDSLDVFRRDARHRRAMCIPLGEDDDAFDPIAEAAGRSLALIDAKLAEVQRADDLLLDARAAERARRVRAGQAYADLRRRLAAEAAETFTRILPVAPSKIGTAGIKRGISIIERGVSNLRLDATPEVIRTTHLPGLERELARLRAADLAEDEVASALSSLRLAVALFKLERERERQVQYADLLKIVGKSDVEEFFLKSRASRPDDDDDEEPVPTPGG